MVACVDCGTPMPWVGRGRPRLRCDACLPEWTKEDGRRRQNAWNAAHPEFAKTKDKLRYRRNADVIRKRKLAEYYQRNHNITQEERDRLVAAQNGLCMICKNPPEGRGKGDRLHIDHDHATGERRGLLCGNCNTMIGLAGEDPAVLLAAVDYLRKD
jgi:hypothetical protein